MAHNLHPPRQSDSVSTIKGHWPPVVRGPRHQAETSKRSTGGFTDRCDRSKLSAPVHSGWEAPDDPFEKEVHSQEEAEVAYLAVCENLVAVLVVEGAGEHDQVPTGHPFHGRVE